MRCAKIVIAILAAAPLDAQSFRGDSALRFTGRLVAIGPRPAGTPAHLKSREFIASQLQSFGCRVTRDTFLADTPGGKVAMENLIASAPGSSGRAVAVTGHYDTKLLPVRFLGANDGGSSAGFLLELARISCGKPRADELLLVFFDGEEAIREWTDEDSLYGSRRTASNWVKDGTARRIKALINVDMIGDKQLGILREMYSTSWLRHLVWDTARELGYEAHFLNTGGPIGDDHLPFVKAGMPAVNLIDFDYGPNNAYWHTKQDTLDKLDARSFQIVGDVVLAVLRKLEKR